MSDDELQVIQYWKEKLKGYKKEIEQRQKDEFKGYGTAEDIAKLNYCNIHIMLNLIEKQQTEIKKLKENFKIVDHECSRLEKEDIQKDLEIKELQKELDKYKEMYAVSIADRVNSAFKQEHKNNEDLEMLYKGCQIELENKDKIIDLMAEWFEEWAEFIDEENYYTIFRKMSKEDIKDYFKKKVEEK